IEGVTMAVISIHDNYVRNDSSLTDLERETYLANSEILYEVVMTAAALDAAAEAAGEDSAGR
ncbi:MAG: hypothetical protein ACF8XB_14070, partial [Planctomycetota bacterium JB042]